MCFLTTAPFLLSTSPLSLLRRGRDLVCSINSLFSSAAIHLDREYVLFGAEAHGVGDIHAIRCDAVLVEPDRLAVEENIARLRIVEGRSFRARQVFANELPIEIEIHARPRRCGRSVERSLRSGAKSQGAQNEGNRSLFHVI
jgi:hypothetical protein